ncbi:MAG: putative addiction module antidote protein [Gammaproteobacteria bacterium]|nr:putative addiction module antidote protein [Gammaproteobacteria bacterium]
MQNYEDWLVEHLQDDENATHYLQAALDEYQTDHHTEALMLAFRHIALAQGGITKLAEKTALSRETLYRTLSEKGNPKIETLAKLLDGLGFHLMIEKVA